MRPVIVGALGLAALAHGASAAAADLDDPLLPGAWHLEQMGAPAAWDTTLGAGQRIAIVDTGVDVNHPDLAVVAGFDVADDDADPGPDLSDDDYPHGTAMAGIAAAIGDNGRGSAGVAPAAETLPVKVVGGPVTTDQLAAALRYAVDRDATVILNAWTLGADSCASAPLAALLDSAIAHAEEAGREGLGAVVVISAGNGGCEIPSGDELLADPRMVVVGAVDDAGAPVAYGNVGAAVDVLGPSGVDLAGTRGLGPGPHFFLGDRCCRFANLDRCRSLTMLAS